MRISLQKRQNKFIKLINEQASLTLEGLEALKAYMENQDASRSRPAAARRKRKPTRPAAS